MGGATTPEGDLLLEVDRLHFHPGARADGDNAPASDGLQHLKVAVIPQIAGGGSVGSAKATPTNRLLANGDGISGTRIETRIKMFWCSAMIYMELHE